MRKIDVCLSPELVGSFDLSGKLVVVVDILRATTCMVTALAHDVAQILPVATLEECQPYCQRDGFVTAGERNGIQLAWMDLGNSPLAYTSGDYAGKTVVMSTTNGTLALDRSRAADQVIVGAFVNLKAVTEYVKAQSRDVLIVCAGWKGMVNLEDSLFAGALVDRVEGEFQHETDAPLVVQLMYRQAAADLSGTVYRSAHVRRLHNLGIKDDIDFCLTPSLFSLIPVLQGAALVPLSD
ncbi:2-phosphosulfolactate phosphatase [Catalinimonas alkaloidigena]|uniref:Probable 2-phosphosulfolactate phosphatase n=1 Tax=Catalinimonas alkaloidigena TaxID=1075417 RepID=A0A1G9KAT5_9BACT|nr:2-phosphosulfolactate phosphatase [Catalinimonas alkaloidigena]SDL46545.1 2-phosphosulfolactate phosphatase [Catalinimonas alkaloidigena]